MHHLERSNNAKSKQLLSSTKWERFQQRLINLSVDIDDKSKCIDLLIGAIKTHHVTIVKNLRDVKDNYIVDFNKNSVHFNCSFSSLLQEYERITFAKETITSQIQELSEKKRNENKLTKSRLLDTRQSIDDMISKAFREWESGKGEREKTFVSKKADYVKACTVDALQPEIRKLSLSFQLEMEKLSKEVETRRQHLEKDVSIEFHHEVNQYLNEADMRLMLLYEEREKKWRTQIHEIENTNRIQLEEIKEASSSKFKTIVSSINLDSLNMKSSDESHFTAELDETIKRIQTKQEHHLVTINEEMNRKLNQLAMQNKNKRDEWKKQTDMENEKKLTCENKRMSERVESNRDEVIEVLLRFNHKEIERLENKTSTKSQDIGISGDSDVIGKLKHIRDKNEFVNRELRDTTNDITQIYIKQQQMLEQIQAKEQLIVVAESRRAELTKSHKDITERELNRNCSIYEEMEKLKAKKSNLQQKSLEVHQMLDHVQL